MAELTKAQTDLLSDLMRKPLNVAKSYAPAIRLVALGYATWTEGKYGSSILCGTGAGREALSQLRKT